MLAGSQNSTHGVGCAQIRSTRFSSDVHKPMDKTTKKDYLCKYRWFNDHHKIEHFEHIFWQMSVEQEATQTSAGDAVLPFASHPYCVNPSALWLENSSYSQVLHQFDD